MIRLAPTSPYAFGASVSACGDLLLVGAPCRDYASRAASGEQLVAPTACLYVRTNGAWQSVGQVSASDPMASEGFGRTVALASNSFAVGAPGNDNGDGPVQPFDLQLRRGPTFDSPDRLQGVMTDLFAEYGVGLAADDRRIVVGAPLQGEGGAVYIFDASGMTRLLGATPQGGFGRSVALAGDVLVVGADGAFSNEQLAGACHVYHRDPSGTWVEHCRVAGSVPGEEYGAAVAASGQRFAVGAPGRAGRPGLARGRAEVYELTNDGCRELATFRDSVSFGRAIALSADRLAIGQPMFGGDQSGRIGLVQLPATSVTWLVAPSATPHARLGSSVSLGPDYVAAGMPNLGKDDSAGGVIVETFG